MLGLLFDFFYNLFYESTISDYEILDGFMDASISVNNADLSNASYLSLICAIISLIIILVLCCSFVWKIIKLVGGLIR